MTWRDQRPQNSEVDATVSFQRTALHNGREKGSDPRWQRDEMLATSFVSRERSDPISLPLCKASTNHNSRGLPRCSQKPIRSFQSRRNRSNSFHDIHELPFITDYRAWLTSTRSWIRSSSTCNKRHSSPLASRIRSRRERLGLQCRRGRLSWPERPTANPAACG